MAQQPATDPLLWVPIGPPVAPKLDLPTPSENLFGRLIRNPAPATRPPRERECTEMLAGVLILAPRVRNELVGWWLGRDPGWIDADGLRFGIQTEGAVPGGKRDDLRIEGVGEDDEPKLLISVEVKVGSGFHWGRAVGDDGEIEEELAHQVVYYDAWLASQPHQRRSGLVLAPTDRTERLPAGLHSSWTCITWGELARISHQA